MAAAATSTAPSTGSPSWLRSFFAAHGIIRIPRVITDNGACYRVAALTRSLFDAARLATGRPDVR